MNFAKFLRGHFFTEHFRWLLLLRDIITFNNAYKSNGIPVDTRRKLNVHKMFKRRPGRLLNVLCTFNLRPVSTGISTYSYKKKKKKNEATFKDGVPAFPQWTLSKCLPTKKLGIIYLLTQVFPKKLFLTPWYAYVRVKKKCKFLCKFCVRAEWMSLY